MGRSSTWEITMLAPAAASAAATACATLTVMAG
jgi:hypothetical protein